MKRIRLCIVTSAMAAMAAAYVLPNPGQAQSRSGGVRATRAIDIRAGKLEQSFMREAADLARDYENNNQLEKSKKLLEVILKLNEDAPGVREKIKQLDDQLMSSNEKEFKMKIGPDWGLPVARVFKGRKFRVAAKGEYQFSVNARLGVEGLRNSNPAFGLVDGAPLGALIGMIVPTGGGQSGARPPRPRTGNRGNRDDKGPKPFVIRAGTEISPGTDGQLVLKINAPAGHQCSGTLDIKLSGYVLTDNK